MICLCLSALLENFSCPLSLQRSLNLSIFWLTAMHLVYAV